jgi:predicted chitinase
MASLDHDPASGFLRGDSISDEVEQIAQELKLLRDIERNTADIARGLGQLSQARAAALPSSSKRTPIIVNNSANDPGPARSAQAPGRSSSTTSRPQRSPSSRPAATPRQAGTRDTSGRFTKGDGATKSPADGDNTSESSQSTARSIAGSITDAMRDMGSKMTADVDNVDPTIQAAKELSGIMSPAMAMFKPLGRLFGRNKGAQQTKEHRENITWLRRIWRNQADANKVKGGSMGGMLGMLLALVGAVLAPFKALGRLLGLGKLVGAVSRLMPGRSRGRGVRGRDRSSANASTGRRGTRYGSSMDADGVSLDGKRAGRAGETNAAGRAGAVAKKGIGATIKGVAKGAGGSLMSMGKGLLRKLPLIGALFGAGMIASDAMASDDPELSTDENKKNKWGNVGGGVGSLVGGALGLFGGPAGAIAGSMLGDALGTAAGEWLAKVDFGTVTTSITEAFSGLADVTSKAADGAFKFMKDGWNSLVTTGTSMISSMTDWARDTWKSATETVAGWKDTVADKVQSGKDMVSAGASRVSDYGSNLLNTATGGRLGTGGSNAAKQQLIKAMDDGGITDAKSKAALMANVDHESGGFTKNEENLNYSAKRLQEVFPKYYKDAESARLDAGNPEAIANKVYGGRMGNTAADDGYKYRGRGALQLTGKAQYEAMGKKLGVDLVNNPELAADPKYSAQIAVQHWKSSGADRAAAAGDTTQARKLTNGGTNGLADVNSKYDKYLAQAQSGDLTPQRRADEGKFSSPATVNAAVASTMATLSSPTKLAGAQPVTPIGIMAPAQPRANATVARTAIPGVTAAPSLASYAPAAADASQARLPTLAEVKTPVGGGGKEAPQTLSVELPLTQNLQDRGIAHAANGGIGMMPL